MRSRLLVLLLGLGCLALLADPRPGLAQTPPSVLTGPSCSTDVATGIPFCGLFRDYWNDHGRLAQQGYAISPLLQERSYTNGETYWMQYFERAVFEYHPDSSSQPVQLTLLGASYYLERHDGFVNASAIPGMHYFSETHHNVGDLFYNYWNTHGGLDQQGYPISEASTEISEVDGNPYLTQYFQRAVFEYHPENAPPYDVLLSQLGTIQFERGPHPDRAYIRKTSGTGGQICRGTDTPAGPCVGPETARPPSVGVLPNWAEAHQTIQTAASTSGSVLARLFQGWAQVLGPNSHMTFRASLSGVIGTPCPTPDIHALGSTLIDHTALPVFTALANRYCITALDTGFSIQTLPPPGIKGDLPLETQVKVAVFSGAKGLIITDTVTGKPIFGPGNPLRTGQQVFLGANEPPSALDAETLRLWQNFLTLRGGGQDYDLARCAAKNTIYPQATPAELRNLGCALEDEHRYSGASPSTAQYFENGFLLADPASKPPTIYVLYTDPPHSTSVLTWESYPGAGDGPQGDFGNFLAKHPTVAKRLGAMSPRRCPTEAWSLQRFAGGTVLSLPSVPDTFVTDCGVKSQVTLLLYPTGATTLLTGTP